MRFINQYIMMQSSYLREIDTGSMFTRWPLLTGTEYAILNIPWSTLDLKALLMLSLFLFFHLE